ncbi:putative disease resistance protein, partial [Mucuna pruriens]
MNKSYVVVRYCKGLTLAIKVIGRSLYHRPIKLWQKMVEEFSLLDVLEHDPSLKECFIDLGLFPERPKNSSSCSR